MKEVSFLYIGKKKATKCLLLKRNEKGWKKERKKKKIMSEFYETSVNHFSSLLVTTMGPESFGAPDMTLNYIRFWSSNYGVLDFVVITPRSTLFQAGYNVSHP